ncbi:MAG: transketolase C-terminal domain-containing protein [Bacteroidia bacterium]|nr:transketolase [Bacteroidia bacterium]MDW8159585.1 transketolase C-terminal domain-containing protein [Bacteroidia bacterium]
MNYETLLQETVLKDEKYIVMTAENRALIRNLPPILGRRFIDTGITEQCMVGMAAGLAVCGRVPIIHALATFLTLRAFEFIRTDVGIPALPVKLSSFVPGFLSEANGPTHQALEDIALMRSIPHMQVFAPADEQDMLLALPTIWSSPYPSYCRINLRKPNYSHQPFELGKAEVITEGSDLTILVYGTLFAEALETLSLLTSKGLSVGLINLRSLQPIDENCILQAVKHSRYIVTIEDHFLVGGLYSILAELLLKKQITANVIPFALNSRWYKPALLADVLKYEGFTAPQLTQSILHYLDAN